MKIQNIFFTVFLVVFYSNYSNACKCRYEGLEKEYYRSDLIFVGKVVSIDTVFIKYESLIQRILKEGRKIDSTKMYQYGVTLNKVSLLVFTKIKGDIKYDTIQMQTARSRVGCGYPFEIGEKYIVYSEGTSVSSCSGTIPFDQDKLTELEDFMKVALKDQLILVSDGAYERDKSFAFINQNKDTIVRFGDYKQSFDLGFHSLGIVETFDGKFYAINTHGEKLFEVKKHDYGSFHPDLFYEDLIRIIQDGKIGFADRNGKTVIPPQFKCADSFRDGRAKVSLVCNEINNNYSSKWESESWFYIDKKGNILNE